MVFVLQNVVVEFRPGIATENRKYVEISLVDHILWGKI